INSTLGIGGMWDVATDWGMQKQTGDFGQTLASWGVGEGPYLMLPLVGPSDMRDAFGRGVDTAMSPWQWITLGAGNLTTFTEFEVSDFTADAIVRREKNIEVIDQLRANSVDPYSTARSAWLQHRRKQLGQTQATSMPKMDEE
ncbi:MAG TPA: MlaA family lipoprotein, partial [Alphaproteobacteria bacterium]|nr:MlaA family lipoprotein [Alphaproteobacteria bacterium]